MNLNSYLRSTPLYLHRRSTVRRQTPSPSWITRSTDLSVQDAKSAVEAGLVELEQKRKPEKALEYFNRALELNPTDKEAGAAAYNIACCYVQTKEWEKAADQIVTAVKDYRLDFSIPKNDDDLTALRNRPEWEDVLSQIPGSMSTDMKYNMISEVRSPFRFFRFWIFGGLSLAAGIGLLIITAQLISSISNGEPLQEPVKNLGINLVALGIFSYLFLRDYKAREKDKEVIAREDLLSGLQVQKPSGEAISLAELRGKIRPVIICGTKQHCQKAVKSAQSYKPALQERGVALIPVVLGTTSEKLKALQKDFETKSSSEGFGEVVEIGSSSKSDRWELKIADGEKWKVTVFHLDSPSRSLLWCKEWIEKQKKIAGITDNSLYFQIQLDGQVRSSGSGLPPWNSFVADLPPMDDIRTKLTDNIGI